MARVDGPLFSSSAHGTIGDGLTFSKRKTGQQVRFQKKQADVFTDKRADVRALYRLILACWQNKTAAQKKVFNDLATQKNLHMTGWDYFVKLATARPLVYLGLVAYWSLNVENAAIVKDISKNGKHGTLKPTYPSNCPVYVDGKNNKLFKALSFDGSDDKVTLPSFTTGSLLTMAAWFKRSDYPAPNQRPILNNYDNPAGIYFGLSAPYGYLFTYSGNSHPIGLYGSTQIWDNNWHFGVYTLDGSKGRFFLDGNLDKEADQIRVPFTGTGSIGFGGAVADYWLGIIDDTFLYNRALSANEVKALYKMFE